MSWWMKTVSAQVSGARVRVLSVRAQSRYAAEAYSFDLVDTTGKTPDLLTGSIPEATSGVTASHIYALMLAVEEKASTHNLLDLTVKVMDSNKVCY